MKKKSFFVLSSTFFLLSLVGCNKDNAVDNIQNTISDTVSNALPNLFIALAQLAAFLVTCFIFFKFAYKPIKKRLQNRKDKIKKDKDDAENAKIEAENYVQQSKNNIEMSKKQADLIVQNARVNANKEADKIISEANDKAIKIEEEGKKEAQSIKEEYKKKAHDEIISSAIEASKEILKRNIDQKDNEKIVDDFLKDMKDSKDD